MSAVEDTEVHEVAEVTVPVAPKKPRKPAAKPARKAPQKAKGNGKAAKGKTAKARKPRTVDPAKLDQFGFRKGSLKSKAAAMYAGKNGATLAKVKETLKSTQFNLLTELAERGFKIKTEQVSGVNDRKVTNYHIVTK